MVGKFLGVEKSTMTNYTNTNAIQTDTIVVDGTYAITAYGAEGGCCPVLRRFPFCLAGWEPRSVVTSISRPARCLTSWLVAQAEIQHFPPAAAVAAAVSCLRILAAATFFWRLRAVAEVLPLTVSVPTPKAARQAVEGAAPRAVAVALTARPAAAASAAAAAAALPAVRPDMAAPCLACRLRVAPAATAAAAAAMAAAAAAIITAAAVGAAMAAAAAAAGRSSGGGGGGSYLAGDVASQSIQSGVTAPTSGGGGEVTITLVPCFLAGTHIRTPRGEVLVEALRAGEFVLTADGQAVPIIWIGARTVAARFAAPLTPSPSASAPAPWLKTSQRAICSSRRTTPCSWTAF